MARIYFFKSNEKFHHFLEIDREELSIGDIIVIDEKYEEENEDYFTNIDCCYLSTYLIDENKKCSGQFWSNGPIPKMCKIIPVSISKYFKNPIKHYEDYLFSENYDYSYELFHEIELNENHTELIKENLKIEVPDFNANCYSYSCGSYIEINKNHEGIDFH